MKGCPHARLHQFPQIGAMFVKCKPLVADFLFLYRRYQGAHTWLTAPSTLLTPQQCLALSSPTRHTTCSQPTPQPTSQHLNQPANTSTSQTCSPVFTPTKAAYEARYGELYDHPATLQVLCLVLIYIYIYQYYVYKSSCGLSRCCFHTQRDLSLDMMIFSYVTYRS